jgi:hypothetical protein
MVSLQLRAFQVPYTTQIPLHFLEIMADDNPDNPIPMPVSREKMELAHELAVGQLQLNRDWMREQVKLSARGQWMATVLAIFCIVASVVVTLWGHDWVGGVLGGSTVVSLATVFVVGQATKKEKPTLPKNPKLGK